MLESNIKKNYRHQCTKRHMYVGEGDWQMIMADKFDTRGNLWRISMINLYAPDVQACQTSMGLHHDLKARSYLRVLINEQPNGYSLNRGYLSSRVFCAELALRYGR